MNVIFFLGFFILNPCRGQIYVQSKSGTEDQENLFVPTHEWKVIKEGQVIPRGLQVRVNLETGLKEAKFIDDEVKAVAAAVMARSNEHEEAGYTNTKYTEAEVKEALKNIKYHEDREKQTKRGYRSYEELKSDLKELNLEVKTDPEILNELISNYKELTKDNEFGDVAEILLILEDLDYLVHQYDNANVFVNLNGFQEVIFKILNSTNVQLKRESLKLLGSSVQNNAAVQIHALELNCVGILLRTISLESDFGVQKRAIFALSGLLRQFPIAQIKFIENAGLSVFANVLEKAKDFKIQLKIVTLINDLLLEHKYVLNDAQNASNLVKIRQYEHIYLKHKLKEHDWCKSLKRLLKNVVRADINDYDGVEKCLQGIILILDSCEVNEVNQIQDIVSTLRRNYQTSALSDAGEEEADLNYYSQMIDLCNKIIDFRDFKVKVEL